MRPEDGKKEYNFCLTAIGRYGLFGLVLSLIMSVGANGQDGTPEKGKDLYQRLV